MQAAIEPALTAWRAQLGDQCVLTTAAALEAFTSNTLAAHRRIPAVLRPSASAQLPEVLRIARAHGIALYPISTGHNWGYGSANPVTDNSVVVDLSALQAIDDSEIELGIVTVEPGVTQRKLREFLDDRGYPFLVPVHGGGPDCSLMGNALERGYGITPYADHFGAVTALEAVLPNGEWYRSALTDLGAPGIDHAFKWGLGPYLDGLFSQGSFGIVTRMTIALAPIPERVETFFFGLRDQSDLEDAVAAIRAVLRSVGNVTGSINLMNARRVLAMMEPFPTERVGPQGVVPQAEIDHLARKSQVMPWSGIGALYGTGPVVKAAKKAIRRQLKQVSNRLVFLTPGLISGGRSLLERMPARGGQRLWNYVSTLDKSLQLIAGAPSEIALPLAYWKAGTMPTPNSGRPMNPDTDGCGLIWYSPLVPMLADRVRAYVEVVDQVCREHGVEPLITLTSLSDRCFDSTVPLLFDRDDPGQVERAHACYQALLNAGQTIGCVPYRASIETMGWFTKGEHSHWRLVEQIKAALDPDDLIAPGRYCPPRSSRKGEA
jgi:4-cresol dehydrogenase (hydroxylating)